jgi:hypothetical protein
MAKAGPIGPRGPSGGLDLRVITNQPAGMCDASEFMLSAYCAGGEAKLHITGILGASCEGDRGVKVVVVCVKR